LLWRPRSILLCRRRPGGDGARFLAKFVEGGIILRGRRNRNFLFACRGFVDALHPRANVLQSLWRELGEFEASDSATFLDPDRAAFALDAGGRVQVKSERADIAGTHGHHGAKGKTFFAQITHHAAVARGELDVDEAQRTFAEFASAIGINRHKELTRHFTLYLVCSLERNQISVNKDVRQGVRDAGT
jgi:hypothetical protein